MAIRSSSHPHPSRPGPRPADRARVVRRRRAVLGSAVGAFGLGTLALVGAFPSGTPAGRAPAPAATAVRATFYVARPGDTLWGLAERLAPGADPRPLVDRLAAELPGGTLVAGERLALPPPG